MHRVTDGNALPDEIVADVVGKTDGVPLFIEELTKTLHRIRAARATRPTATNSPDRFRRWRFPNTLHDS